MRLYLSLLFVLLLSSCDKESLITSIDNGNYPKLSIKIDSLNDQSISMNSQFGPYAIILKNAESSLDSIYLFGTSSNWSLVDTNSIVVDKHNETITLTIFPTIGKVGESQISLIVQDKENRDTAKFLLTVVASNENQPYPTILNKLKTSELLVKQNTLNQMLGSNYTANLDSFGLLGHLGGLQRGVSNITAKDQAISIAKDALLQFTSFTNVTETSLLTVQEATNHNPTPLNLSDWTVSFKNQVYNNIEVWDTEILVLIKDGLISMDWHHYKDIFIPATDRISRERAKRETVGKIIKYSCWVPSQFTITDSSIVIDSISLCIYPMVKKDSIELRVTWKIPIYSPGKTANFYYFIDVVTGENLGTRQLFIC